MKKNVILSGVLGSVLIFGVFVGHAAKWDKNSYVDANIQSGYYDADSIKVKGTAVNWTEKYILTSIGVTTITANISKHQACKQNIDKMGDITQIQLDYQIEKGKFRGVAKRYYNKGNKLLCTNKDTGDEFKTAWNKIVRGSPIEQAQYDLVSKYKVKFP